MKFILFISTLISATIQGNASESFGEVTAAVNGKTIEDFKIKTPGKHPLKLGKDAPWECTVERSDDSKGLEILAVCGMGEARIANSTKCFKGTTPNQMSVLRLINKKLDVVIMVNCSL